MLYCCAYIPAVRITFKGLLIIGIRNAQLRSYLFDKSKCSTHFIFVPFIQCYIGNLQPSFFLLMFHKVFQERLPYLCEFVGTRFRNDINKFACCSIFIMDFVIPWDNRIAVDHFFYPQIHHKRYPFIEYCIIIRPASVLFLSPDNHILIRIKGLYMPWIFIQGSGNHFLPQICQHLHLRF